MGTLQQCPHADRERFNPGDCDWKSNTLTTICPLFKTKADAMVELGFNLTSAD